eukprot:scaffold911_cov138-Skeletonema_menzelii.AAC.4
MYRCCVGGDVCSRVMTADGSVTSDTVRLPGEQTTRDTLKVKDKIFYSYPAEVTIEGWSAL